MDERRESELIALSDEEQSVTLRIFRGEHFGDGEQFDALHAEIAITSAFVNGKCELYLSSYDIDNWSQTLDLIESGHRATWLESGRSPRIIITPAEASESECTEVSVHDVTASHISVTVPIAAPVTWISDHREMLRNMRNRFPLAD
ncbi:DUF5959 family protein [Streptomyces sp. NPDC051320]|uniref:DUF5959 family protein n=1 Tax=Streptomyces sp. NPDC051320 TaxID=3154644 RepID=UPI003434D931